MRALFCIFLLSSFPIANALFLAGQSEQGGDISVLCEGQAQAYVSLPGGELRALALDSDFQAKFAPASQGPYTFQCGNETMTVAVSLPAQTDARAYSSGENILIASGAAIAFVSALLIAANFLLAPRTLFSKSGKDGRTRLHIRAGEDLREITITDPQGGENGAPLQLFIPHLSQGADWAWEYEQGPGEPMLSARLAAKCKKGGISLVSGVDDGGKTAKQDAVGAGNGKRALPKHTT